MAQQRMHLRDSVPYSQEHELERIVMGGHAGPSGIHQPMQAQNVYGYGAQGLTPEQQLLLAAQ